MVPPVPPVAVSVALPQNVPPPLTVTAVGSGLIVTVTDTRLAEAQPAAVSASA